MSAKAGPWSRVRPWLKIKLYLQLPLKLRLRRKLKPQAKAEDSKQAKEKALADYELGLKIIAGEADRELGAGLIREAAELGLVARGACTACFWWRGSGWRKTRPKAVKWHELAARQGDSGSMFDLGSLCERGDAIAKDLKTAA